MQLVTDRLRLFIDNHPTHDTNYSIACYILDHFDDTISLSITELAACCFVSQPTLSRFCRALGYDDFYHFRQESLTTYSMRQEYSEEEKKKLEIDPKNILPGIHQYLDDITSHLITTVTTFSSSQLDHLLERIHITKKIVVFGELFSGLMASYMQIGLLYVGKNITTCSNLFDLEKELKTMTKNDMLIILSVEGNSARRNPDVMKKIVECPSYSVLLSQNDSIIQTYPFDDYIKIATQELGTGKYSLVLYIEILTKRYAQLYKA